jgi:catechol 2,3-dioxygenase
MSEQLRRPIDPDVDIGHVHLKVAEIERSLAFYCGVLGFELQQRMGDEAAFVSAGGYHHHIGLNTWTGEGAPPPPPLSRGLRWFEIRLPGEAQLAAEEDRLRTAGFEPERVDGGVSVNDPSGNGVLLTASA